MKDLLLAVAEDWSLWDGVVPTSVPRRVSLPVELRDTLALVVQGVRRCGKSTLLQQLVGRYDLDPRRCAFVNFEDPRLSQALTHESLDVLVTGFRERLPDAPRLAFFLDEVQWVDGWQKWLRSELDRRRGHVFVVTGSNADLLGGELGTVLTGRHLTVELYPFDLGEHRTLDPSVTLEDHLARGGFPEPLLTPDGDRLLRQYFHDIIERDVRERVKARSSLPIRHVVQMAFESAGAETSLRRVAGSAGLAVDTAASYLEACEAAYLLLSCPYFAFSERKRQSRNRKYYPIDTALRRVACTRTGEDRGKALECAVHLALRRRFGPVSYWRERGEVDFVLHHEGRIVPVQVAWDAPTDRQEKALEEFYEHFPQAEEAITITSASFDAGLDRLDGLLEGG